MDTPNANDRTKSLKTQVFLLSHKIHAIASLYDNEFTRAHIQIDFHPKEHDHSHTTFVVIEDDFTELKLMLNDYAARLCAERMGLQDELTALTANEKTNTEDN